MPTTRDLFFRHLGQTSPAPLGIEPVRASGPYIYDIKGKRYFDAISGFSVANIGHSHPKVVEAVKAQAERYMHLIVYGEFVQRPQVVYATKLVSLLPPSLDCVYFTNSGTEATEGAMKLAKRATGRAKIISFEKAYHGSTQGALSLMGDEYFKNAFRPLLPEVYHFPFNGEDVLSAIDGHTACVVVEAVQAESGIIAADPDWLLKLRETCTEHGCLLVMDEIQSGFGRTGGLWAFEAYGIVPDILLLGKALGGGMPLGAFIADKSMMSLLSDSPVLGHITTFGGHPVSCAAGLAALEVLLESGSLAAVPTKEQIIKNSFSGTGIKEIRTQGLWAYIGLGNEKDVKKAVANCLGNGLITDWFLFNDRGLRLAPPLIATETEIEAMCQIVLKSLR